MLYVIGCAGIGDDEKDVFLGLICTNELDS